MNEFRVVLVTGAARRVGANIVRALHADGAKVIVHYRSSREDGETLCAELNQKRADSAALISADLADLAQVRRLAAEAHAVWGQLDGLVNNASGYYPTALSGLSAEQFDELVGSNLRAPLFLIQACVPQMREGSVIVNLLDIHARRPQAGFSAYLAAKSGLWTLTEALALELAPRIRVNGVAPGHMLWADEPQFDSERQAQEEARIPMGRLGGAAEVANAVRFLFSDQATYLNGAIIPVDGGLRLN